MSLPPRDGETQSRWHPGATEFGSIWATPGPSPRSCSTGRTPPRETVVSAGICATGPDTLLVMFGSVLGLGGDTYVFSDAGRTLPRLVRDGTSGDRGRTWACPRSAPGISTSRDRGQPLPASRRFHRHPDGGSPPPGSGDGPGPFGGQGRDRCGPGRARLIAGDRDGRESLRRSLHGTARWRSPHAALDLCVRGRADSPGSPLGELRQRRHLVRPRPQPSRAR